LRRTVLLLAIAALTAVPAAAAELRPVRRDADHPRVRAGTITIPRAHQSGRVRVIVRLGQPPLAAAAAQSGYRAAGAQRRAIPEATVSRSFRVLVNGLTVDLPATRLPALTRLGFVTKVYPSLGYTVSLNRSPALIGATAYTAATGARGTGIKIGVVDDGVDPASPFFTPNGM
jgi:hypothetical protein